MVTVGVADDENYLWLTEGHLPDMQTILAATPQRPQSYRSSQLPTFSAREEAAAWMMSASARRFVALSDFCRRYDLARGEEASMKIPYETWVLATSLDGKGKLDFWFEEYPKDTDYRLFICHNPIHFEGRVVCAPWSGDRNFIGYKLIHREFKNTTELKKRTKAFFEEVLAAYKLGTETGKNVIEQAGHPHWVAYGHPLRSG